MSAEGVFPSEMTSGESNEHQKSTLDSEASNPAGRYGHDTDMAACLLFLAGPGGVFLNNQILYPDGGMLKCNAKVFPCLQIPRKYPRFTSLYIILITQYFFLPRWFAKLQM